MTRYVFTPTTATVSMIMISSELPNLASSSMMEHQQQNGVEQSSGSACGCLQSGVVETLRVDISILFFIHSSYPQHRPDV